MRTYLLRKRVRGGPFARPLASTARQRLAVFSRLLLLTAPLAACDRSAGGAPSETHTPTARAVEVVPVLSQRLDTTTRLPGELSPYEAVALYPRISAFVEQVLVDRGSHMRKGQLLVRLSAPELAKQRAESQAKLAGLQSTYERTRAAAETPGAVAKHDLEISDAAAKAEEARLAALRAMESYLRVVAPFDGVVTERNVHPGALVGPAQGAPPMLRVEATARLRLSVAVPEAEVGAIADGAQTQFTVRAWPGQHFAGTIRRVSHSVDPRTRAMLVELDVDNAPGRLAPGMYAEVLWPIRRPEASLSVPATAIVQTPDRSYVDGVRDGAIKQIAIQRGIVVKDRVEVFGALSAGDMVLRRGSEEMKDGTSVLPQVSASDAAVVN